MTETKVLTRTSALDILTLMYKTYNQVNAPTNKLKHLVEMQLEETSSCFYLKNYTNIRVSKL